MATGYRQGLSASVPNSGRKTGRAGRKDTYNNDRSSHSYYKGYEIQNVKSARVYVFGDDDHAVDDEHTIFEMPEMRSRLKGASYHTQDEAQQPEYFMRDIAEGETLQAIALKYACPVSELKRLNNLIQDQEFFALKTLKIPMRRFGILSEQITSNAKDHKTLQHSRPANWASSSNDSDPDVCNNYFEENNSPHDFSDPDTQMKVLRTLSIRENFSSQEKDAEKFLRRMDDDLKKFKQSPRLERESLSEVISVLTNKSISPLQTSRPSSIPGGATCGISWLSIVIVSLLVAIIVPVVLFLYIKYALNSH